MLPRHIDVCATKVAVGSGLAVDRALQIQITDDRIRSQIEDLLHCLLDRLVGLPLSGGTAAEGQTNESIQQAVEKVFDLRPDAIIRDLDLKRPIYSQTAAYGHFGRTDIDVPWEHTDKVDDLRAAAGV